MTQEEILKLADMANKKILSICKDIKKDVKHLPDIHAVERIRVNLGNISGLQYKLEILKTILSK